MYIIEIAKLQAGDIFLTTQKHIVSKAIKAFTSSDYSHAMLHVGDGSYIHSDGDGVQAGNVQRLLFDDEKYIQVLRLKDGIDRKLIDAACAFARNEVGKQYSVKDAINTKNPLSKKSETNRQFCSRLVAQSFESVGLKLVKNSSYCAPQELDDSEFTVRVSDCVRKATDAEIEFANTQNPLENQANITNSIFTKTRSVTGQDIQTFEQLSNYLLENIQHDGQITNIIMESGYLFMWQHEVNANPWRYTQELFMSLPVSKEKLNEIAVAELKSALNSKQRYVYMYEQYMRIWQAKRLKYAAIHIMLYQKLIELTDLRISNSSHVIENT
ncbi:YiiX/YebB-like N1pC/P60 family cysteine hydrolase [Methylomonas sp. DH-1]|uniref:YiiX/YebB-like N1pC/P60 family cysteine hydrolase n=1 Tax=Methylomonas sp. (strain DH-1) TaxID=1727196 RepID=UPI0007C8D833|nr:YiiX/YebB-like N1pC/P60 family cysteine hydrolase [Methylomonas sp. DH-1]